jgi:hypothetical protein
MNATELMYNKLNAVVTNQQIGDTLNAWKDSAVGFFIAKPVMAVLIMLVFVLAMVIIIKTFLDAQESVFQMAVSNGAFIFFIACLFFIFYLFVDAGTITLQTFFN